ncbi:MAG: hypothetical protein KGJ43_10130, partial [Acidobacteriota bacterium]|nr:hypothetical protein [Acidobacteriota bacterium]
SKLAGIPVPVLGLIGYAGILASLLMRPSERARAATALLAVAGFAFSGYLTYREVFTLEAICEWCVSSATIMTLLAVLATWRFMRHPPDAATPGGERDAGAPGHQPGEPGAAVNA